MGQNWPKNNNSLIPVIDLSNCYHKPFSENAAFTCINDVY
jgi:hypothetical protein